MNFLPRMAIALFLSVLPTCSAAVQQLQCNPCQYGFGPVQVGTSSQFVIQLTNSGNQILQISSVSVTGSGFSIGQFLVPANLKPGASTQLPVVFTPSGLGRTTGKITVHSNAPDPTLVLRVWGRGVDLNGATLGVSPSNLNFGNVTLGSSATLQLTLSASNGPVTISSAQSSSAEFTTPGLALPLKLASGQKLAITVAFTPNASGTASGNLVFYSDATNSPTTVALTGTGVAAGNHEADLAWDSSQDPVIGYNVYRGTKTGGPYGQINSALDSSTNYSDNAVQAGTTYFYVVTAVNSENQESRFSNEVKAVIPSP